MGRIAITEAAFEAIAKTLPIGSVAPAASTKRYGRNHRNSTSTCKNRSSSTRARAKQLNLLENWRCGRHNGVAKTP
jgi:hypothetical protein